METLEPCPEFRNTLPWEGASRLILTLQSVVPETPLPATLPPPGSYGVSCIPSPG